MWCIKEDPHHLVSILINQIAKAAFIYIIFFIHDLEPCTIPMQQGFKFKHKAHNPSSTHPYSGHVEPQTRT